MAHTPNQYHDPELEGHAFVVLNLYEMQALRYFKLLTQAIAFVDLLRSRNRDATYGIFKLEGLWKGNA